MRYNLRYLQWKENYDTYLQSEQWQIVRQKVWARAKGRCERCNKCSGRDVHHLRYRGILFRELEGDNLRWLQLVCPDCHDYYHPEHACGKLRSISEMEQILENFISKNFNREK